MAAETSWRVGDAVAYARLRISQLEAASSFVNHAPSELLGASIADAVHARSHVLRVDGYDRRRVDSELANVQSVAAFRLEPAGRMDVDRRAHFESIVVPLIAAPLSTVSGAPELIVLLDASAPCASRSTRVAVEMSSSALIVQRDELRGLHPQVRLARSNSAVASEVDGAANEWMQALLGRAREDRRSVILDGWHGEGDGLRRLVSRFKEAGFTTAAVVSPTTQAQAMLTSLEWILTSAEMAGTRPLRNPTIDQRTMTHLFDEVTSLDGRGNCIETGERPHTPSLSTLESLQWLSSLRRMHEHVRGSRRDSSRYASDIAALHRFALDEVLPTLDLPPDSAVAAHQRRLLTSRVAEWADQSAVLAPHVSAAPEQASLGL
jgi:hypothetical protein